MKSGNEIYIKNYKKKIPGQGLFLRKVEMKLEQVVTQWEAVTVDSPGEHDHEVHDVPAVPQVRALVQRETQGQDLYPGLETEDGYEVGLCLLLQGSEAGEEREGRIEGKQERG